MSLSQKDLLKKDFSSLFHEEISLDVLNKTAKIDYSKNKTGISTKMGKDKNFTPFKTSGQMFGGDVVISGYSTKLLGGDNIQPRELRTIIYNLIKGKEDEYTLSEDEKRTFINRTVIYLNRFFNQNKISFDVIVLPKSSSSLNKIMAKEFTKRFPYQILILSDNIEKSDPNDIKISDDAPDVVKKGFAKKIASLGGDKLEIKKLPPSWRRFISNISKIDDIVYEKINGKNVLVIDDVLTSGITIGDIIKQLRQNSNPDKIYGVTIFKN